MGRTDAFLYDNPSVLIGRKGTINKPAYIDKPFWTVDTLFYSEVNKKYLPKFIYYKFCMIDWLAYNEASGVPSLNASTIESVQLSLPPRKEEQTAIANVLSDVDALITSLEKLITKKRAIKTAAMQQLLTGKKRLPPFDQTDTGYKQTELGEIPEDWEVGIVKGLVENMTSGLSRRLASHDIGLPVLISGNIQNKKLVTDNLKYWYKDDPQGASIEDYVLNDGDILLCFINSMSQIGKPCIFKDIGRPAIYTTNLFRIVISNIHSSEFAYYLFSSAVFQKQIQLISKIAVNQASFTKPDFLHIKIIHPSDKVEQCAIAETLSDLDSEIDGLEQRLIKTQKIKLGMMQELLTGRTRLI
jgi:type I restriction enzyme S subunit